MAAKNWSVKVMGLLVGDEVGFGVGDKVGFAVGTSVGFSVFLGGSAVDNQRQRHR